MKLTFIGMSGAGKTFLAKKLEKKGFKRYSADDFIESKLTSELKKYGYAGIHDMARWMGQPYEERYSTRSRRYLDLERKTMEEIIKLVKYSDEPCIVDSTGSIIYLEPEILNTLSMMTKIIYFETPKSVEKRMYEQYLADPKPVIWGDIFQKNHDESYLDALARCYPGLLAYRRERYKQSAHYTVSYDMIREDSFTVDKLLQIIQT